MNARDVALDALVRVDAGAYSNLLLPQLLRVGALDARDRAFATSLVYSVLREQRLLDHVLAPHSSRSLDDLDPDVRAALRLGAQQSRSGIPPHAAVGETVAALGRRNPRARGFVNAVLRAFTAAGPPWPLPGGDDTRALAVRLSHPDWIVEQLIADLGVTDARAVLESANRPAAVTLRANPRRTTPEALAAELAAAGMRVARGELVPDAVVVTGLGDPRAAPAVAEGRATPQDQASQAVIAALDPQPGERVLDVAAAPGGKTTAIAERVGDAGIAVGVDVRAARVARIVDATRRLGLGAVAPVVADGRALPFGSGAFDRVLVDAPCSGLGALRRRPEARWRLDPSVPAQLAALQRALLAAAAPVVRPGGVVGFSVCTLTTVETLGVDEWAAAALPHLRPLPPPGPPWRPWGRGALLLPSAADTDGMFLLLLA